MTLCIINCCSKNCKKIIDEDSDVEEYDDNSEEENKEEEIRRIKKVESFLTTLVDQ